MEQGLVQKRCPTGVGVHGQPRVAWGRWGCRVGAAAEAGSGMACGWREARRGAATEAHGGVLHAREDFDNSPLQCWHIGRGGWTSSVLRKGYLDGVELFVEEGGTGQVA
jgi:hypothetical protein